MQSQFTNFTVTDIYDTNISMQEKINVERVDLCKFAWLILTVYLISEML